jgi:aspartate-semialdehyde dehydrogenase
MDILGNVVPFIGGEEEKMQQETQKILGISRGDHIEPLAAKVSAHCNRVAVVDGHTVTVSVEFSAKPSEADLRTRSKLFRGVPQERNCPARRSIPVQYMTKPTVRSRAKTPSASAAWRPSSAVCALPGLDWKFVALGHNTVRGAAGAAVLNAELMHSEGLLD